MDQAKAVSGRTSKHALAETGLHKDGDIENRCYLVCGLCRAQEWTAVDETDPFTLSGPHTVTRQQGSVVNDPTQHPARSLETLRLPITETRDGTAEGWALPPPGAAPQVSAPAASLLPSKAGRPGSARQATASTKHRKPSRNRKLENVETGTKTDWRRQRARTHAPLPSHFSTLLPSGDSKVCSLAMPGEEELPHNHARRWLRAGGEAAGQRGTVQACQREPAV